MNTPSEKRASPRTALDRVVQFERTASEAEPPSEGLSLGIGRDIGPGGASLLTDCPLRPGEVLKLHVPAETEPAEELLISEVTWTQPTRNGFRVGLRFLA
ncbi:MAG TPA: PilZ domain-containing protein [Geothrix sp.]|jgi:hypothetical protein